MGLTSYITFGNSLGLYLEPDPLGGLVKNKIVKYSKISPDIVKLNILTRPSPRKTSPNGIYLIIWRIYRHLSGKL